MERGLKKSVSLTMIIVLLIPFLMAAAYIDSSEVYAAKKYKIGIEEIEYDPEDREVSIEFYHRVQYKRVKVYITDKKGKNYTRYIQEADDDDMEIKVKALKYGRKYYYKIKGIRRYRKGAYRTISGSFRAIDS